MTLTSQTVSGLPVSHSYFADDLALSSWLSVLLSEPSQLWAAPVLQHMGSTAAQLEPLAAAADRHPPLLHPRDRFGNRVDTLEIHPAYRELQQHAYGQGMIGHYYDPAVRQLLGADAEVVKFAQGYLFSQGEQGLFCPICMTDGTAWLIDKFGTPDQRQRYLPRLTSQDVNDLWEGAMFLTEKTGGSDVGANETVARRRTDGLWTLHGEKWFCSNAGAEVVMVLARPEGAHSGTRGLGLFILRRHRDDGRLNHLHLERLKPKLGTRSMGTGEVVLDGAVVEALGDVEKGFLQMAEMLNLSRLYNTTASIGLTRRVLREAVRYTRARHTFGESVLKQSQVRTILVEMLVEQEAALATMLTVARSRGRVLSGIATEEDRHLVRLATPLLKYSTARLAVRSASEAVELHGGNGYIEDWPLARLFRDAQVLPIWEGTTNILVLDTLRAIHKEKSHQVLTSLVQRSGDAALVQAAAHLDASLPQAMAESSVARRWCDRAMQVLQAAVLHSGAVDARSQAVRENYSLRHFAADRHELSPAFLGHGREVFDALFAGLLGTP